jgi:hypothetical protein
MPPSVVFPVPGVPVIRIFGIVVVVVVVVFSFGILKITPIILSCLIPDVPEVLRSLKKCAPLVQIFIHSHFEAAVAVFT